MNEYMWSWGEAVYLFTQNPPLPGRLCARCEYESGNRALGARSLPVQGDRCISGVVKRVVLGASSMSIVLSQRTQPAVRPLVTEFYT